MSWLELGFWGIAVALVVSIGLLLPILVVGLMRSPLVGVWTLGAAHFVDTLSVGGFSLRLLVNTSPFDVSLTALGAAAVLRLRHLNWKDPIVRCWVLATVVWIGLFIVGATQFKSRAGVEYRYFFYLSFGALYFMTFEYTADRVDRVIRAAFMIGMSTLAIAGYRWGHELLAPGVHYWQENAGQLNWRVIDAQQTFVLVLLALAGVASRMGTHARRYGYWPLGLPILLGAILLMQHRTNWVVLAFALLVLFALRASEAPGRTYATALLAALAVSLVIALAATSDSSLGSALRSSAAEPFERRSTMAWRLDSWRAVVSGWAAGGPVVWLTGQPFGAGWYRFIESAGSSGGYAEQSPHNFYVTVLARGGLLALTAFCASILIAMIRLVRRRRDASEGRRYGGASFLAAVIAAQAAFFVTYAVVPFAIFFLGLALAVASRPRRLSQPVPDTSPSDARHVPPAWPPALGRRRTAGAGDSGVQRPMQTP